MALQELQLSSVNLPAHWQPPNYQFNERVIVFICGTQQSIGTIKGMEYVETSNQYGYGTELEVGWYFYVKIDANQPQSTTTVVAIEPQANVMKLPANW